MPYFYDHQERFRILLVDHETDYGEIRLTVDTPKDLELLRRIFANFPGRDDFSWLRGAGAVAARARTGPDQRPGAPKNLQ